MLAVCGLLCVLVRAVIKSRCVDIDVSMRFSGGGYTRGLNAVGDDVWFKRTWTHSTPVFWFWCIHVPS
jgi:hypothetical protein